MHGDGPFIFKSSEASISARRMRRMALLKFFDDFHLLLNFQLSFLEKYQQLFNSVLFIDFRFVFNQFGSLSKSKRSYGLVIVDIGRGNVDD